MNQPQHSSIVLSVMDQPIPLRMRRDLSAQQFIEGDAMCYVLKDPIAMQHFRYLNEEYYLLNLLDGKITRRELQQRFEVKFPGSKLSLPHLERLLSRLFYQGLVSSTRSGGGEQLYRRWADSKRIKLDGLISKVLAIRLRGFRMQAILDPLEKWTGWLFSPVILLGGVLLVVSTVLFVILNLLEISYRLPAWAEYLSVRSLFITVVAVSVTKIVHEIAHALVCRRFGAECNEIGLMFLMFIPCLYCDVTDTWTINNRFKRAAVAAAGIGAELIISCLAFWYWWSTYPGFLNSLALQTAFLCSLNSVLVNGQPLLRYDGYFVLSDLVGIPNLWSVSRRQLRNFRDKLFLKNGKYSSDDVPDYWKFLLVYGIASVVYQWMIFVSMFWIAFSIAAQWRMQSLFWMLVCMIAFFLAAVVASRVFKAFLNPIFMRRISLVKTIVWPVSIAALLVLLLQIPVSWSTSAFGVLRSSDQYPLIALTGGTLKSCVNSGDSVFRGQVVAKLENFEIRLQHEEKRNQIRQAKARLEGLLVRRSKEADFSGALQSAKQTLQGLEQELALIELHEKSLTLLATQDGVYIAPRTFEERLGEKEPGEVEPLLSEKNLGKYVEAGALLGRIETVNKNIVQAYLSEDSLEGISEGLEVAFITRRNLGVLMKGRVARVALEPTDRLPAEFTGEKLGFMGSVGSEGEIASTMYLVEIDVSSPVAVALHDSIVRVWIETPPVSLGHVAYKSIVSNFRL